MKNDIKILNINLNIIENKDNLLDEFVIKNLQCDIQNLIEESYKEHIKEIEINCKYKYASSLIGKKVRVKKYINGSCYASIPVGSVGKIVEIRNYDEKYPIGCKFEGILSIKWFLLKELEIIE